MYSYPKQACTEIVMVASVPDSDPEQACLRRTIFYLRSYSACHIMEIVCGGKLSRLL